MVDTLVARRVRIHYDDQAESFAAYLPVEGIVSRRCASTAGPTDWYLIDLSRPLEYERGLAESSQLERLTIRQVLVRSRWPGMPLRHDTEPSVFLLLVRDDQEVPHDPIAIGEFIHVCWARCKILDAVLPNDPAQH